MTTELEFAPSEDPFIVQHGGFYRRWFSMIDDINELKATVAKLEATTEDKWVPVWRERGRYHEDEGDRLEAAGDFESARREYLQAKTYYAIGRFPGEITDLKAEVSADCARAYRKACAHLDPPVDIIEIPHQRQTIVAHYRAPHGATADSTVAAVLVMCGADVFKEDRGWAQEMCIDEGMAALVMDGPATGENPFPWSPSSVSAWEAAIDWLRDRHEIDADRVGAFGISRGGYSVMQLAGTAPDKVRAVVANAGHPFGYRMNDEEMDAFIEARNQRRPPGGSADRRSAFVPVVVTREGGESLLGMGVVGAGHPRQHHNAGALDQRQARSSRSHRQHLLHARARSRHRQGGPGLLRRRALRLQALRPLGARIICVAAGEADPMTDARS